MLPPRIKIGVEVKPEEIAALNRQIAEWLGWLSPTKEETEEYLAKRWYELRHWTLHRRSGAPIENFSSYYWTSPDFTTDEAANAILLEIMPRPHVFKDKKGMWGCCYVQEGVRYEHNADRKLCIALAFKARKESQ